MIEENNMSSIERKRDKNFYIQRFDRVLIVSLFATLFVFGLELRGMLDGAELFVGYAIMMCSS